MSTKVSEMLLIACESTGTELSKPTVKLWMLELACYPEMQVLTALRKCCREVRGRLALGMIIDRIDDGRPGPEEAWSEIAPMLDNEISTTVWTDEMRESFVVAHRLRHDKVAAHMAFKEKYRQCVNDARLDRRPIRWTASLGWDLAQRQDVLTEAARQGKLAVEYVRKACPELPAPGKEVAALVTQVTKKGQA